MAFTDTINPRQTGYRGDEAFAEFLREHDCPLSINTVKFRFWGQVVSIAPRVRPAQEIQDIWNGDLPDFETDAEAQAFMDGMFSLWNALAEMNTSGRRLSLPRRRGLDSAEGLGVMIENRLDELNEGFLTGFVGDMTVHDEGSPKTETCLSRLIEFVDRLEALEEKLDQGEAGYPEARREFVALDKSAQRLLDNLVKAANAERNIGQRNVATH